MSKEKKLATQPVFAALSAEQQKAIELLAGDRKVKIDGRIDNGKLRIVGLEILPIGACNSGFDLVDTE